MTMTTAETKSKTREALEEASNLFSTESKHLLSNAFLALKAVESNKEQFGKVRSARLVVATESGLFCPGVYGSTADYMRPVLDEVTEEWPEESFIDMFNLVLDRSLAAVRLIALCDPESFIPPALFDFTIQAMEGCHKQNFEYVIEDDQVVIKMKGDFEEIDGKLLMLASMAMEKVLKQAPFVAVDVRLGGGRGEKGWELAREIYEATVDYISSHWPIISELKDTYEELLSEAREG